MPQAAASLDLKFVHCHRFAKFLTLEAAPDAHGFIRFLDVAGYSYTCLFMAYAVCDVRAELFRKHRPTFAKEAIMGIHCLLRNYSPEKLTFQIDTRLSCSCGRVML